MQKGERVTTAETSAKLDSTLDRVASDMRGSRSGRSGGGDTYHIDLSGVKDSREARKSEASVKRAIAQGVAQAGRYR